MNVSVIIVSLNGRGRIDMPLRALAACDPAPGEVIVVDNGSTDGLSGHVARCWPAVGCIRSPRNLGFAGGNNLGIVNATGDVVVLLNDDTEPEPGWLAPLAQAFAANPRLGVAGCQLLYPGEGGRVQHLGAVVHANGLTDHLAWGEESKDAAPDQVIPCDYVTGAAIAIRREVMAQVGLLDQGYFPIYFEEVDFCEAARRAGWELAVVPAARVVHHESQTTGRLSQRFLRLYHRNRIRYLLKNRGPLGMARALRAEAKWIVGHQPWEHLWPCALAWAWAPFQLADLWRRR